MFHKKCCSIYIMFCLYLSSDTQRDILICLGSMELIKKLVSKKLVSKTCVSFTPRTHLHIRLPDLFSRYRYMLNVYESFIEFMKEMVKCKTIWLFAKYELLFTRQPFPRLAIVNGRLFTVDRLFIALHDNISI